MRQPAQLQCDCGRCTVVALSGECDLSDAQELREYFLDVLAGQSARIVVDLGRLDFLDCAAARALVATSRRASLLGGRLVVARPTRPVGRLLELTGVGGGLAVYPAIEAALAAIRPGRHPSGTTAAPRPAPAGKSGARPGAAPVPRAAATAPLCLAGEMS